MDSLTLKAPAKINLALHILGRRPDGYHELSMLMEKISLCDDVRLEKTTGPLELLAGGCDFPPGKNLAYRAAKVLREAADAKLSARIHLKKIIPIGTGLGGGSSDAAAVLKGLNQLWELNWPVQKLSEIGVKLGADIPFFLYDGPALVGGIGEKVAPQPKLPKLWMILVYPGVAVETKWAYQAWDTNTWCQAPGVTRNQLTQGNQDVSVPRDFAGLIKILHNDFEAVVFEQFPEIGLAKSSLLKAGAGAALMSGSGSAVFGLFKMKEERERALKTLAARPNWKVFAVEN